MKECYKEDNVHVWLGVNHESEEDYLNHFSLDYSTEGDFDDISYKICDFCKIIGFKWYDEDRIGIISRRDSNIAIDELLEDVAVDYSELNNVRERCFDLGIKKANALLWYSSEEVKEIEIGYDFFGLKYLGCFKGD